MQITGTVRYLDLEGGFWGIVAEGGRKLLPIGGVPSHLKRDGQRVRATVEAAHVMSTRMWGEPVRVTAIQAH